jgi:hypothetical protein
VTPVRLAWLLFALLAAGCAETGRQAESRPADGSTATGEQKIESQPLKYLKNRNIKPQATRPLNVRAKCAGRDGIGNLTHLDLMVREAEVKSFAAQVSMKQHGTCRFNLQDFEQTEKMPQPLLTHKRESGCSVRMWEQGPKLMVAFNGCQNSCEGDAFSYLWPIMVEAKTGRCT